MQPFANWRTCVLALGVLMVLEAALAVFTPREPIRTFDWARQHVQTETGLPYDDHAFPHLGAPGGPMDALDCRQYFDLWLQWGSRLGKTFVGQIYVMKTAAADPCPMMFVAADAKLAKEVIGRTERMLERCDVLTHELPKKAKRSKTLVELRFCRMFVAWPRSSATLADKAVRFGHAAEIDKYEHLSTSKEADPLELFDERFKEFPTHKKLKESTPALKHSSRIERGRLESSNAQFFVPCPHCGRYQILAMGDGKRPGGIVWEHDPSGRPDHHLARRTAHYVCAHCEEEIDDAARGPMMRGGVWIPEGAGCDDDKAAAAAVRQRKFGRPLWRGWKDADWLKGEPLRDDRDYGAQLSSLYALSRTWGDIAAKHVASEARPHLRRNFVNSWLGQTWELVRRQQTWETLGDRLMRFEYERGVVPPAYTVVVAAVDKQEHHFVAVVDAWTSGQTSHTIDYFEAESESELLELLGREYRGANGTRHRIALTLIDTGFRPKGVYELCERAKKRGLMLIPCRGATRSLGVTHLKKRLGKDTAKPGAPYVLVDTISTQDWIERQLHEIPPGQAGGTTLFRASLIEHKDFLEQLLNEAPVQRPDQRNQVRETWNRIDETIPNDFRDTKRYAAVAMLLRTRGKDIQQPSAPDSPAKPPPKRPIRKPTRTPIHRPGGWLNMP